MLLIENQLITTSHSYGLTGGFFVWFLRQGSWAAAVREEDWGRTVWRFGDSGYLYKWQLVVLAKLSPVVTHGPLVCILYTSLFVRGILKRTFSKSGSNNEQTRRLLGASWLLLTPWKSQGITFVIVFCVYVCFKGCVCVCVCMTALCSSRLKLDSISF